MRAARNGFDFVRDTQSFATGGWGPNETFRAPGSGEIGESLTSTHASFETPCGAYGHFKITRYLMRVTGDSRYGDSMEQVLYNTILGAKPHQARRLQLLLLRLQQRPRSKFYHEDKWPCCSGTFPQITADYGISSYFRAPGAVYVNLFVPSRVTWRQTARAICARTENALSLCTRRHDAHPYRSPRNLRCQPAHPGVGGSGNEDCRQWPRVFRRHRVQATFAAIRREWKSGDRIECQFDMPTRLEAIDPEHPQVQALLTGPLALFAVDSPDSRFHA